MTNIAKATAYSIEFGEDYLSEYSKKSGLNAIEINLSIDNVEKNEQTGICSARVFLSITGIPKSGWLIGRTVNTVDLKSDSQTAKIVRCLVEENTPPLEEEHFSVLLSELAPGWKAFFAKNKIYKEKDIRIKLTIPEDVAKEMGTESSLYYDFSDKDQLNAFVGVVNELYKKANPGQLPFLPLPYSTLNSLLSNIFEKDFEDFTRGIGGLFNDSLRHLR